MTWQFKGIRKLEKEFNKKSKDIKHSSSEGLENAAKYLLELSQPLVPVDTGRLKESGKAFMADEKTAFVTYEAFNPENGYEYAPIQHEALDFHHNVGQAKYLEEPFLQNMDKLVDTIAVKVKEGVDK